MRFVTSVLVGITLVAAGSGYAGAKADGKNSDAEKYDVRPVGEPKNCISITRIRGNRIIDNDTIDFKMANGDIYRNTLPRTCHGLKSIGRFSYRTEGPRLCSSEIITVLQQTGGFNLTRRNSCGISHFQKITKTKRRVEAE